MNTQMRDYYQLPVKQLLRQLETSVDGLSDSAAHERHRNDSPNDLPSPPKRWDLRRHMASIANPFVVFLLATALIAFFIDFSLIGYALTGLVIISIGLFLARDGYFQRVTYANVLPKSTLVRRGGKLHHIRTNTVALGDIVLISAGDTVPADLRLIEAEQLFIDASPVIDEPEPFQAFTHEISGHVRPEHRHNVALQGSVVTSGKGVGVVIATAPHTTLAQIALLSRTARRKPGAPLHATAAHLNMRLAVATVSIGLLMTVVALFGGLTFEQTSWFVVAIALVVMPLAMPLLVNLSLVHTLQRFKKLGIATRRLSAPDTLGTVRVLAIEAETTFTHRSVQPTELLIGRATYTLGHEPAAGIQDKKHRTLSPEDLNELKLAFVASLFASNAPSGGTSRAHHDTALRKLSEFGGLNAGDLDVISPLLRTFPYDTTRLIQTVVRKYHYHDAENTYAFSAGSPEALLDASKELWLHGHVRKLTAADKKFMKKHIEELEADGKQAVALAYRTLPKKAAVDEQSAADIEQHMVWLGLVTLEHNLRDEVSVALSEAHDAGVSIAALATEPATVRTLSRIDDMHVTGGTVTQLDSETLDKLTDQKLAALLHRGGVILSNITPSGKLRLVGVAQNAGYSVAIAGAGLEDAPALSQANVSLALGQTSSVRHASDFTLRDSGFGTIMTLIEASRAFHAKLRSALFMLLSANLAKLVVLIASLVALIAFDVPVAIALVQILLLGLIIELIPTILTTNDPLETDQPKTKRHDLPNHVLGKKQLPELVWTGLVVGGLAYANYLLYFSRTGVSPDLVPADTPLHWKAMTLVVLTLALCHFANLIMHRSHHGILSRYQLHNRRFWLGIVGSTAALWVFMYIPVFSDYLKTLPLTLTDWLFALLAAGIYIAIREFVRYDQLHHRHHVHKLHLELGTKKH